MTTRAANIAKRSRISKIFNLLEMPRVVVRRVWHRGVWDTLRWIHARLSLRFRDWRWGVDTRGDVHGSELTNNPDCNGYTPIGAECFELAMRRVSVTSGDVFLDYGSGKGRAILLAAMRPFAKCIGVELSSELCDIAETNVTRARATLRCQDIEVIAGDATQYCVPNETTFILLNNPFIGQVLASVVDRIRVSVTQCPRELTIAYIYPADEMDSIFDNCDWLVKQYEEPIGIGSDHRFVIYHTTQHEAR